MKKVTLLLINLTLLLALLAESVRAEFDFLAESRKLNAQAARAQRPQTEEERIKLIIDETGPISRQQLRQIMDASPDYYYAQNRKVFILEEQPSRPQTDLDRQGDNWGPYAVFGYTKSQIFKMVDDEGGQSCSKAQVQEPGGMTSRYCHAAIVKAVDQSLQRLGVKRPVAALLGSAVVIPNAYLQNQTPSMLDFVIADYPLVIDESLRVEFTAFADGALFIVIRHRF